jgi:hypothetical protein
MTHIEIGKENEMNMTPQQQHEYDEAIRLGHTEFLEEIPVAYTQIKEIYEEVKKKMPDLVIAGGGYQCGRWIAQGDTNHRLYCYQSVKVAYANNPAQVVGSVGFDGSQFFVNSRLVENARYSHWNSEHKMRKSKHMKNIVKESTKVLLPTQFIEMVNESRDMVARAVRTVREEANNKINSHLGNVRMVLQDELEYMIEIGYTPRNPQVATAMQYIVDSKEQYEIDSKYMPDVGFIWIKKDAVQYQIGGKDKTDEPIHTVGSTDELPEEIRGKLFVLMMTDQQKFIRDVGMKYEDNKFWVLL